MGNFQSKTDVENLKKLYSLNKPQLDKIQDQIKRENLKDNRLVKALQIKQQTLKNKVPNENYNNISKFLSNVYSPSNINSNSNSNSVMTLEDSFRIQEDKFKNEFANEQKDRERKFHTQQKARRSNYETELTKFNMSSNNALKMFQLKDDFTMEQLKHSYKKLALRFHPDRPTGNEQKFQLVTKAYMALLEDLKMRAPQGNFVQMKEESRSFTEKQRPSAMSVSMKPSQKKFDPMLFNKIYQENRIHKAEDDGYENWMNDNELEEKDIEKNEVFGNKFNLNVFNSTFNSSIKKPQDQIVKYVQPQAINASVAPSAELGIDKIGNYSGDGFSDYREAHSQQRLVDESEINDRKDFKTVEELQKHRKNMVPLTLEEIRALETDKKNEEHTELKRQENISTIDNREFDIYDKMNKRMIDHDFFR